jgi:tetratricopeptide (TPR) repeat protein
VGRDLALKLLLEFEAEPEELARFQVEAEALARLKHPGVVSVHDFGWHEGKPYLAMSLVSGESLKARLKREGPLDTQRARALVQELASALGAAHEQGIVHRDLKPQNVLLTPEGRAVLIDFGLAKLGGDERKSLTQSGAIMGSPAYMAPEQARADRGNLGPHTDVYGLGATLYAALTGAPPFMGGSVLATLAKVCESEPTPPSERVPGVDPVLEAVCLRSLAKAPEDRFPDCAAVVAALSAPEAEAGGGAVRLAVAGSLLAGALALGAVAWSPSASPAPPPTVDGSASSASVGSASEPVIQSPAKALVSAGFIAGAVEDGELAFAMADYGQAEAKFRKVIAVDETHPRARLGRARLRAICQDFEAVLAELDHLSEPLGAEAMSVRALALANTDRLEDALKVFAPPEARAADALIDATVATLHVRSVRALSGERQLAREDEKSGFDEGIAQARARVDAALERAIEQNDETRVGSTQIAVAQCAAWRAEALLAEQRGYLSGRSPHEIRKRGKRLGQSLVTSQPHRKLCLQLLGNAVAEGDYRLAEWAIGVRLSTFKNDPEFLVKRAELGVSGLAQAPDLNGAQGDLQEAIDAWPEFGLAHLSLARLKAVQATRAAREGNVTAARTLSRQAREDLERAESFVDVARLERARRTLEVRLPLIGPDEVRQAEAHAARLFASAKYSDAETLTERILAVDPRNRGARIGRAMLRMICKDFRSAVKDLDSIPRSIVGDGGFRLRAELLLELGAETEAREICQALHRQRPNALNAAALARVTVWRYVKRVDDWLKSAPGERARVEVDLAQLQASFSSLLRGARSRAKGKFARVAVTVVNSLALQAQAYCADARQEPEAARALHTSVVELAQETLKDLPRHRAVRLRLLESLRWLQDFEGAAATIEERLALFPNDPEFYAQRGALRGKPSTPQNRNAALDDCKRAVVLWPGYAVAYGVRAQLRLEADVAPEARRGGGRSDRARRAWNLARDDLVKAQGLSDNSPWVLRQCGLLEGLAEPSGK